MRFSELDAFPNNGSFTFHSTESLKIKCNAPTDKGGVYLIYKVSNGEETLIYIGSSRQVKRGIYQIRKTGLGGMKDRIVNGYHPKFGKVKRCKSFPDQMVIQNIDLLKIYWWVTFDDNEGKLPNNVESQLLNKYALTHNGFPDWHK